MPADAKQNPFGHHLEALMRSIQNLRWDDAEHHRQALTALVESAPEDEKPALRAIHAPIDQFARGVKLHLMGATPEQRASALPLLSEAKAGFHALRAAYPERTSTPEFGQWLLSIQMQIDQAQARMARERNDESEAARLEALVVEALDQLISSLPRDDPMRFSNEAFKHLTATVPLVRKGLRASTVMDLDNAQRYLDEASTRLAAMEVTLNSAKADDAIFRAMRASFEGYAKLASAMRLYIGTLHSAVSGEIKASGLDALREAERAFQDGTDKLQRVAAVLPSLGAGDLGPAAEHFGKLTQNLHGLIQRRLSIGAMARFAAPIAVFYTIVTFLILWLALPTIGFDVNQGGVLLPVGGIAVLTGVIGAFGLEATRLVPLLNVVFGLGSGKADPKAPTT